jgi:hypothetical protein
MDRRTLLSAAAAAPFCAHADAVETALKTGSVVIALRHALAPNSFDPPNFKPGVRSTQRKLSDDGRAQARRIGAWFTQRGLKPAAVKPAPGAAAPTPRSWPSAAASPGPRWARRVAPKNAAAATRSRRCAQRSRRCRQGVSRSG